MKKSKVRGSPRQAEPGRSPLGTAEVDLLTDDPHFTGFLTQEMRGPPLLCFLGSSSSRYIYRDYSEVSGLLVFLSLDRLAASARTLIPCQSPGASQAPKQLRSMPVATGNDFWIFLAFGIEIIEVRAWQKIFFASLENGRRSPLGAMTWAA